MSRNQYRLLSSELSGCLTRVAQSSESLCLSIHKVNLTLRDPSRSYGMRWQHGFHDTTLQRLFVTQKRSILEGSRRIRNPCSCIRVGRDHDESSRCEIPDSVLTRVSRSTARKTSVVFMSHVMLNQVKNKKRAFQPT